MKDLSSSKPARVCLVLMTLTFLVTSSHAFSLTILHTNDVHSRVEQSNGNGGPCSSKDTTEGKCFGGFARISTMVKTKRAAYPGQTILLDGGDQYQGTLWHYVFGGMNSAEFMNLVGYDAMALGNHEFDSGPDGLLPFLQTAKFPVLSSNANFTPTPKLQPYVNKSTILLVSGRKIGVVGYTTADTVDISSPEPITFNEVTSSVQREVDILTQQGIDKIIAVGHAGFANDLAMARKLKNVDVVVGGHTNTFLYTGDPPSSEKPVDLYPVKITNDHGEDVVLVVQDYAYGKYLGELHVDFDDQGKVVSWSGNPVLLNSSVKEDADIMKVVNEKLTNLTALKMSVIGQSLVKLEADLVCRERECNLGNVVTDALVRQNLRSSNGSWTDAGIAMVNGGGIRAPIYPGPITVENVLFVFPFRNTVNMVELSGETIMAMLEFGAAQFSATKRRFGGFIQVSGMKITYDLRRPVGERVVQALAVCTHCVVPTLQPLNSSLTYKVLMLNFMKDGGDGYDMISPNIVSEVNLGALDSDILAAYITATSPIVTGLEGRISFLGQMEGGEQVALGCLDASSHLASSIFALVCSLVMVLVLRGC